MNRKTILEFLINKYDNKDNDEELLKDIYEAINDMEIARNIFNNVSDKNLIEVAIYKEEAAKKKIDYLISRAKEYYLAKDIENK